jgi:flagellar motor switch protein FliN/FliY
MADEATQPDPSVEDSFPADTAPRAPADETSATSADETPATPMDVVPSGPAGDTPAASVDETPTTEPETSVAGRPEAEDLPQSLPAAEAPAETELPPAEEPLPAAAADGNVINQAELDALTAAFGADGASAPAAFAPTSEPAPAEEIADFAGPLDAAPFTEPEFSDSGAPAVTSIDLLNDVRLDVKIELGRTNLYIEDVLKLGVGAVVELDKLAGDPVDIYISDRLIARGEVLVLNDNFCVRINDIHSPIPELETN